MRENACPRLPHTVIALVATAALVSPASSLAGLTEPIDDVEEVELAVDSRLQKNLTDRRQAVVRRPLSFPGAAWTRLELQRVELDEGDTLRVVARADGAEQVITDRDPQYRRYGGTIVTNIFKGGELEVELSLAPGSRGGRFVLGKAWVARLSAKPKTICGTADDRAPVAAVDPCLVRIVLSDGRWGSGIMISDNWMLTAHHVMVAGPWTVHRNVPASSAADGSINPPAAGDQFTVQNLNDSTTSGNTVRGDDWAVVEVPDNASGAPGAGCRPTYNCDYQNTTAGTTLTVTGFGLDTENARNGVLQVHGGPSVAGGDRASHFRYRADTRPNNSGSPVTDGAGRLVGIHTNGGCAGSNPETGSNSGTLITNAGLQAAVLDRCGMNICPVPHMVALLDRTGSMTAVRSSTGNTRCNDARSLAISDVQSFFSANPAGSVAVWTFANSGPTDRTGGFVNRADALATLNALTPEGCSGLTPLAEAICAASDALATAFPNAVPNGRILAISSDGGENNSTGECAGFSSSGGPPYAAGSWQRKVTDKVVGQDTVLSRFWGSVTRSAVDPETGALRGVADQGFLQNLAQQTGGVYQPVDDSAPLPPPLFGGSILYGTGFSGQNGLSTLYTVDPRSGQATAVGPIGFERCGAIDFNTAGVLYAACERADGSNTPVLVAVDLDTGAGAEVGPTGLNGAISDLSFRHADGALFAYDAANDPGHTLFEIDVQNGLGTLTGETGLAAASGNAMAFSLADTLFHSQLAVPPDPELNILDPATGAASFVAELPITPAAANFYRFSAMDVEPSTGVFYAILNDKAAGGGGGTRYLATIDPALATVQIIGPTETSLDGLAWSPPLQGVSASIFVDGFETGDSGRWSQTLP